MRRGVVLALAVLAACSSGSPIVPAGLRTPVAVAPFLAVNPHDPQGALIPLIAVASFAGDELRLIDPATDQPVAAPSPAWALAIPTLPRPRTLISASLNDGGPDLVLVASNEPRLQVLGTWLDGSSGYGIVTTIDLTPYVGTAAQLVGIQIVPVTSGPATGSPPVAPPVPGQAWAVVAFAEPGRANSGQLAVLPFARAAGGHAIALSGAPVVKAIDFSPNGIAAAPDNVHLYFSTLDLIPQPGGSAVHGIAEMEMAGGIDGSWPVNGFPARGAPTYFVAAAFVGERTQDQFYNFVAPALRVYAALDPSGCGQDKPIVCGIATFDPALQGLASDPAPPGPPGWPVPTQGYRTPMTIPALPLAFGIAMPARVAAAGEPSTPSGSQVCHSPATPGNPLPLCPTVSELPTFPPFNGKGYPQDFMDLAPARGQIWTSVTALAPATDGLSYVLDLGRFGLVAASSMLNADTTRTRATAARAVGPAGPFGGSTAFGFPDGTAAVGFWLDFTTSGAAPRVVGDSTNLALATAVWPGFTRDEHWLVTYQGVLPGFLQRRGVVGLTADDRLYVAIQDPSTAVTGAIPASGYWVTGAVVAAPELGVHLSDIPQFLLDKDPCPSTRPNWIPVGQTTPVYDSTRPPQAHETVVVGMSPPDPALYPGGALVMGPAADPVLAQEYACLVSWFTDPAYPERRQQVLTAVRNLAPAGDYVRGVWLRASGFLLAGSYTGYAGRPEMDVRYQFAWADEEALAPGTEALVLARKARRFYYPSAFPTLIYSDYPGMTNPMQPGPVVGFRLGRFCPTAFTITGCDATISPPARDAGVDFSTASGLVGMSRYPSGTSGGNYVTSFDKSVIPGLEFLGRVFYASFVGDTVMMVPPGLAEGQAAIIR